ncbi:MAG: 50S ribosomal protein L17 [Candidatus Vogelbacteria bacterium]|nr:50S ribosomal protein L17 [Candidatus Vogelbacteria bacterium]
MRHHNVVRKFGRKTGVRRAFMRSLAKNLIENGKITTTEARAKELRPYIEKMITIGRGATPASRGVLTSKLGGGVVFVKKLVEEVSPKFKDTRGGYTRIVKLGKRLGDASPMAIIEFVK